jgi:hypothetical protein
MSFCIKENFRKKKGTEKRERIAGRVASYVLDPPPPD